ncbi:MAG: hypothetical protein HYT80_06235 [Euryarchaeota archaeon]|nr:hypothetical protein [Euryarchaeota archaeon]
MVPDLPRRLDDLLSPKPSDDWLALRGELEEDASAAYAQLGEDREESFGIWHEVRDKYLKEVKARHKGDGYEASPLYEEVLWDRCAPVVPGNDALAHVRFLRAMLTPFTRTFQLHKVYRYQHGGNWQGQTIGLTGTTKSSIELGGAEWWHQALGVLRGEPDRPMDYKRQMELMVYHPWRLPDVYANARAGEIVVVDENIDTSGEGSRTLKQSLTMMDEQNRQSMVNGVRISPTLSDHAAQQYAKETLLVNWETRRTRSMCFFGEYPLGFLDEPWCSPEMFSYYSPWKEANVKASKGAYFNDNKALFRIMNDLADRPEFVAFAEKLNKPTKEQLKAAVLVSWGRFMPDSQLATTVNLLYTVAYGWDRWKNDFQRFCNEPPTEGMRRLGAICYRE